MADFTEPFIKLAQDFSWRRLLGLLLVLVLVLASVAAYDRYTSYFTLNRLAQATDLVIKLQTLDSPTVKKSPEIERATTSLLKQVIEAIDSKPLAIPASNSSLFNHAYAKFVSGTIPWLLLVVLAIYFNISRGNFGEIPQAILGSIIMGGTAGLISISIPTFWWPFGNIILIPLLHLALLVFLLFVGSRKHST